VTFGRRPRTKRPEQVIEELDEMHQAGFFSCFIVDYNFIGNKKLAKELLRLIIPWQQKHGYPLRLTTEASVNLADDAELLELLYRANFRSVFIGIETPRVASLNETKKFQNTRGDSLDAKLARIQNAGLDISAGFIVGFDNDDETIFEDQFRFIQDNGILLAMVGMLAAVPKSPLFERLKQEGRLRLDDANCNIVPKQMTPAELQQGYWQLLKRLYTPQAFLERYFRIYQYPEFRPPAGRDVRQREGKQGHASLRIRIDPSMEVVLGAAQRWQSATSRERVSALFLQTDAALPKGCLWLCAVHEPLCDPLAFLQIHPRRDRGQASAVQFGLGGN
jgi:radical SAM superfamily enzyme YgiQ (UPF0313 family)